MSLLTTELKMTEWKNFKGKTIYAQSALARRVCQSLTSSAPFPPPPHPLAHPQTAPIGMGIGYWGGRWVRKSVCGGG